MSLLSKLVIKGMRLARLKDRVRKHDLNQLQKYSIPHPPASVAKMVTTEALEVNGAKGVWLNKQNKWNGVLVYLHGGGYIIGPLKAQWQYIARLARATDRAALVIDYQQLPQFPFPAGLNDVLTIITHLQENGILPAKWFLLGDSAGGGLALATTYKLRENNAPLPQKLILMSQWLDINMSNPAFTQTAAADPMLSLAGIRYAAAEYSRQNHPHNPFISPIFGEVHGLPPLLLQVGTAEIFLWDIRKFYLKLIEAQVPVQYEEYPDLFHVFVLFNYLPEAKKALKAQVEFLKGNNSTEGKINQNTVLAKVSISQ